MLFPIGDDNIEGGHTPLFSHGFLLLNIGVFVLQATLPPGAQASFVQTWGAVPYEIAQGVDLQTLLTSIFLHGSWLHLLSNMLYLWIFADNIEGVVGSFRFFLFYILGGLVAGLTQVAFDPASSVPCVGASGAIAAVMGAYIIMFPASRVKMLLLLFFIVFYIPSWVFLGLWFVQQAMAGFEMLGMSSRDTGGVAWWAHIGGFLFGIAMGFYFRGKYKTRYLRLR
ncbi:MAG: rhomboid family intramembrane serine protease [Lewinellaceae bacterium]|jgi:membrane associated rhomboid family serine protease|nr:rhomboid family intramembrane serine protease [Lewinellaceae bacterium]